MTSTYGKSLEQTIPVVQELGLNTTKNIDFDSGSNSCALPASTTIGGQSVVALASITSTATSGAVFSVTDTGIYTGVGVTQFISDSATTGVSVLMTANGLTTGTVLSMTSTGTIVTTGEMLNIAANSATTSTGLLRVSGTGLTDGFVAELTSGGANLTATGGVLNLAMGAATAGTGLKIVTSGVYAGTTGLIGITATSATTGTLVAISAAGLTTGKAIDVAVNGLTSGNGLRITSSSTDSTARGLIQLTNSGVGSTGAALIRGTQVVQSTHFYRIMTESATGVTLWFGDGTTAQGNLSGTAGDILFNGGSNKPEYCTGTTNWTALV